MIKVFYRCKMNAILGGVLFSEGIAEFDNVEEGIKFAEMFYLNYEVVEGTQKVAKSKKKVKE